MLILVYEANTYNLFAQRNYFLKQSPIASLQKCVLQICSKFTGRDHTEMLFQKRLHDTSAWMHYCYFAGCLQNTSLEEHLCELVLGFLSFVSVQVINNTFYWVTFIIYRPEFVDWPRTFLKVFFILWYIFRNNFSIACCSWSSYDIFISIFSQANVSL